MRKLIYTALAMALLFTSCDEEEAIEYKDYGMKIFEADLSYIPDSEYGTVAYTQQTYFSFEQEAALATGNYGEDSWTAFNLYTEDEDYNITTDVTGWDLACGYYIDPIDMEGTIYPYGVTGVLINTDEITGVAKYIYEESTDLDDISSAFAALDISSTTDLEYNNDIDVINYEWKSVDMNTSLYTVHTNYWYVLTRTNGDIYKMRFTGFHGTSSDERIIKFEYQLLEE